MIIGGTHVEMDSYKDKHIKMLGFSKFQKKLIDAITTSNLYLKLTENNENDMAAQVFWAIFHSSPTDDLESAAIPPPIFSMTKKTRHKSD